MGWETRGNSRYYYRKARAAGRVVSEYVGAGDVAEAVAVFDEMLQDERRRAEAEWRAIVAADRERAAALAEVDELVKAAVAAALIVNGYHQHRRQWRRAR